MASHPPDGYPDVDKHSCRLLGPTALVVQGLMGIMVLLSLAYKRQRESPKRPWRIWLFDVGKQVVGQMFIHGTNVLASDVASHHSTSNACVYYFLNILLDTTFGVILIYLILRVLTFLAKEKFKLEGFESGVYGTPPLFKYWIRQASIYVFALTAMKFLVIGILELVPVLGTLGEWLLSWTWTKEGDSVQVIFTMGIFPIIMNILQFWLIDSIVKASSQLAPLALESDDLDGYNEDREPLFHAPSDDEDDGIPQVHDIENPRPQHRPDIHPTHSQQSSSASDHPRNPSFPPRSSSTHEAVRPHEYPPSNSTSTTPPPRLKEAAGLDKKKRKHPPAPIRIQPVLQPAQNIPRNATPQAQAAVKTPRDAEATNAWQDTWDDSDDWANRVGAEDWTGKRIEQKSAAVHQVWGSQQAILAT